ncbi:MAG: LD-carboxypeptidase [Rubrivivax sp.]
MKPVPLPDPVAPGATLGVVAPAGSAGPQWVAQVEGWLQAAGFGARVYPGCHQRDRYLAGPDARRLEDLHAAFADPAVDAIVCLRGGYGSARLLDRLDADRVARHPKPFIGYSDITALHAAINPLCGFATWHGPMLTSDLLRDGGEASRAGWLAALTERWDVGRALPHGGAALATWVPGRVRAPLAGGNLATLCSLLGTPWAPDLRGAIVFLEDVGEDLYKLDRLLTQLRLAGALQAAAGFVVGSFSDTPGGDDPYPLIESFLAPLGKPVLAGWPAGHCTPHWPLPMGAAVELDAGAQRLGMG